MLYVSRVASTVQTSDVCIQALVLHPQGDRPAHDCHSADWAQWRGHTHRVLLSPPAPSCCRSEARLWELPPTLVGVATYSWLTLGTLASVSEMEILASAFWTSKGYFISAK